MASTRITFGAVLGSVQEAATTISATLNTATKAVGMLNQFVSDAAQQQQTRSALDMADFESKLVEEKAMEEAARKKTVEDFCKQSEQNERLYQAAFNRYSEVLSNLKKA